MDCELVDVVWAAGLLEGEGSFQLQTGKSLRTGKHRPLVTCQMTDKDVLEKLQQIFGGAIYDTKHRVAHHKRSWLWSVSGDLAAEVMRAVRPYMGERRSKAIDAALVAWDEWSVRRREAEEFRVSNGLKAAEYYRLMEKPSLRKAAEKFGVNYETVRNYVKSLI